MLRKPRNSPAHSRRGPFDRYCLRPAIRLFALAGCALALSRPAAAAVDFVTLHSFASADGTNPYGGLVLDGNGVLYGTTSSGGQSTYGTVFSLQGEFFQVLHDFLTSAGSYPIGTPAIDGAGNVYGTTAQGVSTATNGQVFKLTPGGTLTSLHDFNGSDGTNPLGNLVFDSAGNLYGTTSQGGASGCGAVFEVSPAGAFTILHAFNCSDGEFPGNNLTIDGAGNLYGTTAFGGAAGGGTVFEISAQGSFARLHSFNITDGSHPYGSLAFDSAGNLYGTTLYGGSSGQGTAFKLATGGALTTLHSFSGSDGNTPVGGLIFDGAGNLFGTTYRGGSHDGGTAFEIGTTGVFTSLYSLGATSGEGQNPYGGLLVDQNGTLYGTTVGGGSAGRGTVFKVVGAAAVGPTLTPSRRQLAFFGSFTTTKTVKITVKGGNYYPGTAFIYPGSGVDYSQDFTITENTCFALVDNGNTCSVSVHFSPSAAKGTKETATLVLTGGGYLSIPLSGTVPYF